MELGPVRVTYSKTRSATKVIEKFLQAPAIANDADGDRIGSNTRNTPRAASIGWRSKVRLPSIRRTAACPSIKYSQTNAFTRLAKGMNAPSVTFCRATRALKHSSS
jgi:hypothetical protein